MNRTDGLPKRMILYVDETMYVKGHGFRPVFVTEGEPGYRENGDWPYEGKVGQKMPWFFGHSIEEARKLCAERNELMGVSREEAARIVSNSILLQIDRRRR